MCLTVSVTKASEQLSVFRHHLDKRKVCTQGVEGEGGHANTRDQHADG